MRKKTCGCYCLGLICFTFVAQQCHGLPTDPKVISGTAEHKLVDPHVMEIKPSDQAIINYSNFDIGKQEKVRFIQNSSSSCVLTRVRGDPSRGDSLGGAPSQIFGSLESNGKVFLVNPNGIYFGPEAQVNIGSLIASTLDMSDSDFLQENYRFSLSNKTSEIRNEGILGSVEGSIVLIAPKIQNLGSITARAGTALLASGKHVTLDFTGDGLIQFSAEGSIKDALIEHLGDITASTVSLKMPIAKKVISEIVNLEGAEEADVFIEEDGVIKFASIASIEAEKLLLESTHLHVKGEIDATSTQGKGGEVHLFGKDIYLEGASVDASGYLGGGEVLVGGEFQGKGETPWASKVIVNETSEILSNAKESGDGGLIVLWSKDQTAFTGKIQSRGGVSKGEGGLVETSSKGALSVAKGKVDTWGHEKMGMWLLDPGFAQIGLDHGSDCDVTSGDPTTYGSCDGSINSSCYLPQSPYFDDLTTDIHILAYCSVTINDDINMTTASGYPKANVTFQGCNDRSYDCTIYFPNDQVISTSEPMFAIVYTLGESADLITFTTDGGSFTVNSRAETWIAQPFKVVTNGGDITFGKMTGLYDTIGTLDVELDAGDTGVVTLQTTGTGGGKVHLHSMTVDNAASVETSQIKVGSSISIAAPLISNNATLSAGSIALQKVDGASTSSTINISSGGTLSISGAVGGTTPLASFAITSTGTTSLSSITTSGGDIAITPPVTLAAGALINPQGGNVTFSDTVTSSGSVTISNASQTTIDGAVSLSGGLTLSNASQATLSGAVSLAGAFSQTGTGPTTLGSTLTATEISFEDRVTSGGAMTASSGSVDLSSILTLGATTKITGPTGISIDGQVSGESYDFTLATTSSPITIGDTVTVSSFTVKNASSLALISAFTTAGDIQISVPVTVAANATFSATGGDLNLTSSITASASVLTLVLYSEAGDVSVQGLGSSSEPFKNITITGATITLGQDVAATADITIANSSTLTLQSGDVSAGGNFLQTGSGAISLGSSISAGELVSFSGALTITDSVEIVGLGGISFSTTGSVLASTSGLSLTLDAAATAIDLLTVGSSGTPLGPITITGSTVTFGGAINAKSLAIYNSGTLAVNANVSLSSSFQQLGSGSTSLGQGITASSASFAADITVTGAAASVQATAGDLSFVGISESGSGGLTLTATGSISTISDVDVTIFTATSGTYASFGGDVTSSVGIITANGGDILFTRSVDVPTLTVTSTVGSVSIGDDLDVTSGTIVAEEAVTIGEDLIGGACDITATTGNISVQNAVSLTGVLTLLATEGQVDVVADLTAGNTTITAGQGLSVGGNLIVTTGTILATGGSVSLGQVISSSTFSITADTGSITTQNLDASDCSFEAGSSIDINGSLSVDDFTLTDCNGLLITGQTLADTIALNGGSGDLVFQGGVSATTLSTVAKGYAVTIEGGVIDSATTFLNTGGTTLKGGTSSLVFGGAITNTASLTTILGVVGTQTGSIVVEDLSFLSGTSSLLAGGSPITIGGATTLGGSATINSSSEDITFLDKVEGPGALTVISGEGSTTFESSIGATTALALLTATNVNHMHLYGNTVRAEGWIYSTSSITLKEAVTTFSTNTGVVLGDVNGTTSGDQALTIATGAGGVTLGVLGATIPLKSLSVENIGPALIQSITTKGPISITGRTVLSSSSIVDSTANGATWGSDVTLNSIEGTTSGEQGLTINAGSMGVVFLDGNIGKLAPLASLNVTGFSVFFGGHVVRVLGSQSYNDPVTITQSCAFQTAGDITFRSTLDATDNEMALAFSLGGGAVTFLGDVGDSFMGILSVFNSGAFSSQRITAKSLRVGGGLPTITLNAPVSLSGTFGIVLDGGPIYLGGEISAPHLFFRSSSAMANLDEPQPINISGGSVLVREYFNALGGNIGSLTSPIEINMTNNSNLGANTRADFIGDPFHSFFAPIPSNPACIVTFNGVTIFDCSSQATLLELYDSVPKDLFYGTWLVSSWDNLSNAEFFEPVAPYPAVNPTRELMHYINAPRRAITRKLKGRI